MTLYLMRHGIAADPGAPGVESDAERPLTAEGREKTRRVARGLAAADCRPARIAASPLRRARETAALVADVLVRARERGGSDAAGPIPVEECPALAPGGSLPEFLSWWRDAGSAPVLAVGHMPDLARLASGFLARGADLDLAFRKGAVCCLAFDRAPGAGAARMEWLIQPRELRRLGR